MRVREILKCAISGNSQDIDFEVILGTERAISQLRQQLHGSVDYLLVVVFILRVTPKGTAPTMYFLKTRLTCLIIANEST